MKLVENMTKKERKEYYSKQRVLVGFNTGTRTMKTAKHPSRNDLKADIRKQLSE